MVLPVPCRDRPSEGFGRCTSVSTESGDLFLSRLYRGAEVCYNGHGPSGAIKHHLASQDFSRTTPVGCKLPQQKANTGRPFLYSSHEQSFLSPSPSEYPFPCTKPSIVHTIQFHVFFPCP
jgi:hypothetical protein